MDPNKKRKKTMSRRDFVGGAGAGAAAVVGANVVSGLDVHSDFMTRRAESASGTTIRMPWRTWTCSTSRRPSAESLRT